MASEPLRADLSFRSLEDILADAESLDSGSIDTSGGWTAAQIVDHVTKVIHGSRTGFSFTVGWPMRLLGRMLRGRAINAPMKSGFKIPGNAADAFAPSPDVDWPTALDSLRSEVQLSSPPGSMTKASPVFGEMTHEDWVALHCRHAEMHFGFMRRK